MIIFDFFSGTGSSTQAFEDAGHTVYRFELDDSFEATEHTDIMSLTAEYLLNKYGRPDFIWASPPCTSFSVAAIGHHWISGGENPEPRTEQARQAQELVGHTISLIKELNPTKGWLIENPRGMLRKLPVVSSLPRYTVTYCQYGDSRMKPTDLWGSVPSWSPRPTCKNGDNCHVSAPRGAKTGTQGMKGAKDRSRVPYELGKEILNAL
jgi:hypothetical protein